LSELPLFLLPFDPARLAVVRAHWGMEH